MDRFVRPLGFITVIVLGAALGGCGDAGPTEPAPTGGTGSSESGERVAREGNTLEDRRDPLPETEPADECAGAVGRRTAECIAEPK